MSIQLRVVLASLWTAALLAGLSLPTSGLPDVDIKNLDKIVHLVLFFVFGMLWMAALGMSLNARTIAVLLGGIGLAACTEIFQGLLPVGRQPDMLDVVADIIGLIIGIGAYRALHRRVRAVRT